VQHYLRDPAFSHFDTIPDCDRQTDRQTHNDGIYRVGIASFGKNVKNKKNVGKIYSPVSKFAKQPKQARSISR